MTELPDWKRLPMLPRIAGGDHDSRVRAGH